MSSASVEVLPSIQNGGIIVTMKTNIKVSTTDCGYCGKTHKGFHLKLDSKGKQYVICGSGPNAQRVDVQFVDPKSRNPFQPKKWTVDT